LDRQRLGQSACGAHRLVHTNEEIVDRVAIALDVGENPMRRIDRREKVDVDQTWLGVVAHSRVDLTRNREVDRDDLRMQARRQVEGALVEVPDLSRRDAHPLGAEIDRVTGFAEDAIRALEDLDALRRILLRYRPEDPDERSDDADGRQLLQKPAQKESGARQA